MEFTVRHIQVIGASGRHIRYAHADEANRLLKASQADAIDGASIQLTSGLSSMDRSSRDDDRHSASSLKTTFIQRLESGRVIQHKHIAVVDQPLYRLAVTQNLRTVAL